MGRDPMHKTFSTNTLTPDMFLDAFLPPTPGGPQCPKMNFSNIPSDPKDVDRLCTYLIENITEAHVCPSFQLIDATASSGFPLRDEDHSRLLLYPNDAECWGNPADAWRTLEMQIYVSADPKADPFSPDSSSDGLRRKMMRHIGSQFAYQQRNFVFSICIFGSYVRFLRWDRAGCVVSQRFNLRLSRDRQKLAKFLWRYAALYPAFRGFDVTAIDASPRDARILKKAIRHFVENCTRDTSHIERCLSRYEEYPVYRVEVDALDGTKLKLIIGKPFQTYYKVGGRATRVYAAYLISERRLVALKDFWSIQSDEYMTEGAMYRLLQEHDVPNLPILLAAGDVVVDGVSQVTRTQGFSHFTGFTKQRLVQEIYFPLKTIRSSRELTQVTRDALESLSVAYLDADVLHQDISEGNIMVTEDGRGILNDWDCAWRKTPECPKQVHRVGTWMYLSMLLSDNPYKAHEIQDDLESVFWVTLWTAIHHIKASLVWRWSGWETFDDFTIKHFKRRRVLEVEQPGSHENKIGGLLKASFLREPRTGLPNLTKLKWRCQPFNDLMNKVGNKFNALWYLSDGFTPKSFRKDDPCMAPTLKCAENQRNFLSDPHNMLKIFDDALQEDGWLENDAVEDMLPVRSDSEWDQYDNILRVHYEAKACVAQMRLLEKRHAREDEKERKRVDKLLKGETVSTEPITSETTQFTPSPEVTDYPPPFVRTKEKDKEKKEKVKEEKKVKGEKEGESKVPMRKSRRIEQQVQKLTRDQFPSRQVKIKRERDEEDERLPRQAKRRKVG